MVPDAAAAVPAIVESRERTALSAAEAAAGFKLDAEKARALHDSNPGAGEGNSRRTIEITYPACLTGSPIIRQVLKTLSEVCLSSFAEWAYSAHWQNRLAARRRRAAVRPSSRAATAVQLCSSAGPAAAATED